MPDWIHTSRARRKFKHLLGNANHLLITILVGLDAVRRGQESSPEGLRAAWSPRNQVQSALRARRFALSASLSRAVDAVDAYVSLCLRRPSIIQDAEVTGDLHSSGHSIAGRLRILGKHYPECRGFPWALVMLAVTWRNRMVHSLADESPDEAAREILDAQKTDAFEQFRHLDVSRAIAAAERASTPSFKEAASVIQACHLFVEVLDRKLLATLEAQPYLDQVFFHHFRSMESRATALERLSTLWGRDSSRRKSTIGNILKSEGSLASTSVEPVTAWISKLNSLSYAEVRKQVIT